MRIYDSQSDRVLSEITLLLTPEELIQLAGYAESLATEGSASYTHAHLDDEQFQREVMLVVVKDETTPTFTTRIQEIIRG